MYSSPSAYDGIAYGQIATDPSLRNPEFKHAIDNIAYRGRRILMSALSWAMGGGDPSAAIQVYAGFNVGLWFAFAWMLWRALGVRDAYGWAAWAGVMFAAGTLHAVRLALPDLLGLALLAASLWAMESGRSTLAAGVLAAAVTARETCLLSLPGILNTSWREPRAWRTNAIRTAIVALPVFAWVAYIRWQWPDLRPDADAFGTFGVGLVYKWLDALASLAAPAHPALMWGTFLALLSATVQIVYLLARPAWNEPYWRAALPVVVLVFFLGPAVWEGYPGAFTRVVLPLQLAFNVLCLRRRASVVLFVLGNLSVVSGIESLSTPPSPAHELGSAQVQGAVVTASRGEGWHPNEASRSQLRTWATAVAQMDLRASTPQETRVSLTFEIRGYRDTSITIAQDGTSLWQGDVGVERRRVSLENVSIRGGRTQLVFTSTAAAVNAGGRDVAFAVYNVRLLEPLTPGNAKRP